MDLTKLLQTVMNTLLRQFINRGMKAGIDYAARRGKPEAELTPDERDQAAGAADLAKRAQDIAKLTRRMGR